MEYNDIYDENRQPTGRLHRRGSRWHKGEYGLVVCVWVHDGHGNILLTRRAPGKSYAGTWENSGGAAKAGETSLQAIVRELREETGIIADTLTPYYQARDKSALYGAFLCETDWPKDQIRLQPGETMDYLWVSREEAIRMMEMDPPVCVVQAGTRAYFGLETPDPKEEYRMLL